MHMTVTQLKAKFSKVLSGFGVCGYDEFVSTERGGKKVRGLHISMTFGVKPSQEQIKNIKAAVNKLYGKVKRTRNEGAFCQPSTSGSKCYYAISFDIVEG